MVIQNKKRAVRIKRIFYLTSVAIAIIALVFGLMYDILEVLIAGGAFALWFFIFQFADFQYIEFEDSTNMIVLKYYSLIKFGKKDYSSIDFPKKQLHDFYFEKFAFGLFTDLVLVVKTKRGIAEYPSVSFSSLSKKEIIQIENLLKSILSK